MGAPRKKGRGCLVFGLLAGALALILVLAVGAVAYRYMSTDHELSAPSTAGGMTLDRSASAKYSDTIDEMRRVIRSTTPNSSGDFRHGVYRDGDLAFLFVGFYGDYDGDDDLFSDFRFHLRNSLSLTMGKVSINLKQVADLEGDGEARCGRVTATSEDNYATSSICAWATRTTFVAVVPLGAKEQEPAQYKPSGLERVMRDLRADIES